MNIQESSHFSNWIFSLPSLESVRIVIYSNAKNGTINPSIRPDAISIQNRRMESAEAKTTSSLLSTSSSASDMDVSTAIKDSNILILHFLRFLASSCYFLKDSSSITDDPVILNLRWRTTATAIEFFKRFYVYNSMICYDPRIIMLGCLYLAGKVEHHYIRIQDLLKIYDKCTEQDVLDHEIIVLQGVGFDLKINHSINLNHTLLADYKRYCNEIKSSSYKMSSDELHAMKSWELNSLEYLKIIQLTDATLLFNPIALAISSLLTQEPPSNLPISFKEYLQNRFDEKLLLKLQVQSNVIQSEYYHSAKNPPNENEVKEAMTRLKKQKIWKSDKESKKRNRQSD